MSLQDNEKLLQKVQKVLKERNCNKPEFVTSSRRKDILVENDLCGLDLENIKDIDKIRLLSSDLQIFNDESYRYYLIQFIEQFYLNEESIFLLMFIQSIFEGNLLSSNSKRYLQFSSDEVEVVLDFLRYSFDDNNFQDEMNDVIFFWQQHPNIN